MSAVTGKTVGSKGRGVDIVSQMPNWAARYKYCFWLSFAARYRALKGLPYRWSSGFQTGPTV